MPTVKKFHYGTKKPPASFGQFIHPLLKVTDTQITNWCNEHGIEFVIDQPGRLVSFRSEENLRRFHLDFLEPIRAELGFA